MPQRDLYIDRLRTVMTALVLLAHTAMTYGAFGSWYYIENSNHTSPSSILLTLFVLTCNATLLGFFFLLAGYYTPAALERKGYAHFIVQRLLRLGVPLLLFGLLVAPAVIALANKAQGHSVRNTLIGLWQHKDFDNGPMWFVQALLIFSLIYCLWHALSVRVRTPKNSPAPLPRPIFWILSALLVGLAALLLRQVFPIDRRDFGLWFGNFASYIFLYVLGVVAWRRDWLRQLTWRQARASIIAACIAWPLLPIGSVVFLASGQSVSGISGFTWMNILFAFWEPLVAWGAIAGALLWFRAHVNTPSARWDWLGRRAFAVYMFHPLTLVLVCVLLRHWHGTALLKFTVAGALGCIATWLFADPLVRLPGVRGVL